MMRTVLYTQAMYTHSTNALVYMQTTYTNLSNVRFNAQTINIEFLKRVVYT